LDTLVLHDNTFYRVREFHAYGSALSDELIDEIRNDYFLPKFTYSRGGYLFAEINEEYWPPSVADSYVRPNNYTEMSWYSDTVSVTVEIKTDIIPAWFDVEVEVDGCGGGPVALSSPHIGTTGTRFLFASSSQSTVWVNIWFGHERNELFPATGNIDLKVDGEKHEDFWIYEDAYEWGDANLLYREIELEIITASDYILIQLDFTSPCDDCEEKPCICPPDLCDDCGEEECVCPCDCGVCEECDPPIVQSPPDLSNVGMTEEDGKMILTNIDDDMIDEHKITFRWWRKVGNGEWELIDVPPNQPWVPIELHPDDDVTYKCEIIARDEFQLARERSFFPPVPRTNILQNPFLWGLAGIFAIWGIVFIIIAINRREEKRKKLAEIKK